MIAELQNKLPSAATPRRSSLHRYQKGFNEMSASLKEMEVALRILVDELGEAWMKKQELYLRKLS